MAKLIISEISGINGEYDADVSYFTNRELHEIKKSTGLRAGEFGEAFDEGDNDILVAFAVVMLKRAGVQGAETAIWDAKSGNISFDFTEDEAAAEAALPLDRPQSSESPTAEETSADSNNSGDSSPTSSDPPESDPNPTGEPT